MAIASEALEAFGGAGYVEDTGLPRMLRDAQVLPIWEGTTNVLSLDVLRALGRGGSLDPIAREVEARVASADASLAAARDTARAAIAHATRWLAAAREMGPSALEADARRFALTLGRTLELALLIDHATWAKRAENDPRPAAAARRLARHGVDLLDDAIDAADARILAGD